MERPVAGIEDLRDLIRGRWVGTYTEYGRPYPTEIVFLPATALSGPNTITVRASARDRHGFYDLGGTISGDKRFDFTQRRGWIRGEIDTGDMTMRGSWGTLWRLDGAINLQKEYSEEDRRREAEKKKEEEAEARRKEEESQQAEEAQKELEDALKEKEELQKKREEAEKEQEETRKKREEAEKELEDALKKTEETRKKREEAEVEAQAEVRAKQEEEELKRRAQTATRADHKKQMDEEEAQQEAAGATAIGDYPDLTPLATGATALTAAQSDAVKVITTRNPILEPRRGRHVPLKLDKTVDIHIYIKVVTALHGDVPKQLF